VRAFCVQEGDFLLKLLLDHYLDSNKYKKVWEFNHDTNRFSFENYVRGVPKPVIKR
jgi:hypothetical protein